MQNLKLLEENIVPVYQTSTGEKVVYGRELHKALNVKSRYNDWVKNRLVECDTVENEDFECFTKNLVKDGRPQMEHIIKLDTAKEMAMLERNEKGKQVRRYFIEVENKYKQGAINRQNLSPTLQMVYALADNSAKIELEQKRQAEQIDKVEKSVTTMKEIFTAPIGDWKAEINARVREISVKSGISYQELYGKMYGELENVAHCSLKRLCDNKKARMEKSGNTKTAIKEGTTKIAVIYDKPQLKAIFENIVKRYAMSYCA